MERLRAAFGEADITPRLGTLIAGWLVPLRPAEVVRDPILAHIGILQSGGDFVCVVSLDILSISSSESTDLRSRISAATGIPAANVMIAATHSHTGPAVTNLAIMPADRQYVELMKQRTTEKAAALSRGLVPARLGSSCGFEGKLSFNRRYIRRDGIARTQPRSADPELVCAEGPIDPQVGVLSVRDAEGKAMGYIVNFACHPCYYGGLNILSANYPGSISRSLKALEGRDCVTVFLNGACGDILYVDYADPGASPDMEIMGSLLARKSYEVAINAGYREQVELRSASRISTLPLRRLSDPELDQARRQANGETAEIDPRWQRFAPDDVYARSLLELDGEYRRSPTLRVEIQALKIGDAALVAIPGELFVWNGMRIKTGSPMKPTYVASCANGMVGYIATKEAYGRGGYEVTPSMWSRLDPEAPEIVIQDALGALSALTR